MTAGTSPQPVRRAVVRLALADSSGARLAGTDDRGRFAFAALPAGRYTLSATKPGFVAAFHGSKQPGRGPGVPIALADGQQVAVTLDMLKGAVIAGTITDARGRPAPTIPVVAVEIGRAGASSASPARAVTDDLGAYRLYGLSPGQYVVSALPRLGVGSSAITGDILSVTEAELQWAWASRAPNPLSAGAGGAPPAPGHGVTYAPVYYPGTTNVGAASVVSVAAGEERSNVAFTLLIVPTARITGTLLDDQGQPLTTGAVMLYPRRSERPSAADALIASRALLLPRAVMTPPQFSIAGVTPGDYTMVSRTGSAGRGQAAAPAAPPTLWNVMDLTVDGRDQTNLVIRLQPGTAISGSVAFESTARSVPDDVSRVELSMAAVNPLAGAPASSRAVVDAAGTFRFTSLAPGRYLLQAVPPGAAPGARWLLKSAMVNGRDIADVPLGAVPGQAIAGMVVTFSDRMAEIAGTLVDDSGQPVTRYSIVVFSVDRSHWLANARRIRSTTPATDGAFNVTGLPAGEYALAAAEHVETFDLADPAFLADLLTSAHRITVGEGERKVQNLRVGR
jgi:protocatechuate 3,4-dioxygenase beta subunit